MTRLITSIENQALVKRIRDKKDERVRRISLTIRGKKLMDEINVVAQEILVSAQAGINTKDMAICTDVLTKVHETLSGRFCRRIEK